MCDFGEVTLESLFKIYEPFEINFAFDFVADAVDWEQTLQMVFFM